MGVCWGSVIWVCSVLGGDQTNTSKCYNTLLFKVEFIRVRIQIITRANFFMNDIFVTNVLLTSLLS